MVRGGSWQLIPDASLLAAATRCTYSCVRNPQQADMTPTPLPLPERVPVLIVGGGPVGMCLAALLSNYGIGCLVVESDDGYCTGSRAICMSRRSQEILGWVGADKALVAKGLSWVGGRSYWRDA